MGGADQIDARHRRADQPDQAEPEAVPVGDGVALDQPAGGERRGEPGGGGLVDTEPAPEVGHPELALLGDQFERPHRAGDRLDPADLVVAHGATLSCLAQSGLVRLGRHAVLAGRGAQAVLRRDRRRWWGARPRDRLLPRAQPRHHRRVRAREGLARRRQHRAEHHHHPLELPLGRVGGDLRALVEALGGAGGGPRLRPRVQPAWRPQPRARPERRALLAAPRERQRHERRGRRVAQRGGGGRVLPDRQRLAGRQVPGPRGDAPAARRHRAPRPGRLGVRDRGRPPRRRHRRALRGDRVRPRPGRPGAGRPDHPRDHRRPQRRAGRGRAHLGAGRHGRAAAAVAVPSPPGAGLGPAGAGARLRGDVERGPRLRLAGRQGRAGDGRRDRPVQLLHAAGLLPRDRAAARGGAGALPDLRPRQAAAGLGRDRRRLPRRVADHRPHPDRGAVPELRLGDGRGQGDAGLRMGARRDHRQGRAGGAGGTVRARALHQRRPDRRARRRGGRPLMLLVPCPWCGPRDEVEFSYGGQAGVAYPADPEALDDLAWADYLFMRDNPKGPFAERWYHAHGCRRWFSLVRDTATNGRMEAEVRRLPAGGRVDRGAPLGFRFGGLQYQGLEGDTLASALLSNGLDGAFRSPLLGRPRGVMTAGPEEPCAFVEVSAPWFDLIAPATMVPLVDGLAAAAVNGVARLPGSRVPAPPSQHRHAHVETLVVGAGVAGLRAASKAAARGDRVLLVDERSWVGGTARSFETVEGRPAWEWVDAVAAELRAAEDVTLLSDAAALGVYDAGYVVVHERSRPVQRIWHVRARRVVLATGAHERPIAFAGNDRPGVMLSGAALTYLDRFGVLPAERAVVFTTGDAGYLAAAALRGAGARVVAIVDARREAAAQERARADGFQVLARTVVSSTEGTDRVSAAVATGPDGARTRLEADLLAVSGGWNPVTQLHRAIGGGLRYVTDRSCFVPDGGPGWLSVVGAAFREEPGAGPLPRARRPLPGRPVRRRPPDADARGARRARGSVRGRRPVEAPAVLPARRRVDVGRGPARVRGRADRRRDDRRLDARQDRGRRRGRAGVPRPHVLGRDVAPGGGPDPLRPDARPGRDGLRRRRRDAPGHRPLPGDDHHRRGGARARPVRGVAPDGMARPARPLHQRDRAVGDHRRGRAGGTRGAAGGRHGRGRLARRLPVHDLAGRRGRRRPGAAGAGLLLRRARLRSARRRLARAARLGGAAGGRAAVRHHPLRDRGDGRPARGEGIRDRRAGHRRDRHPR